MSPSRPASTRRTTATIRKASQGARPASVRENATQIVSRIYARKGRFPAVANMPTSTSQFFALFACSSLAMSISAVTREALREGDVGPPRTI